MCSKAYSVKRTMLKHFRRRHGFKGNEPNAKDFYTRLEPWECNLNLEQDVMISIFGPPKQVAPNLMMGNFVTVSNLDNQNKDMQGKTNTACDDDDDDEEERNEKTDSDTGTRESEKDNENSDSEKERDIKTHIVKIEAKDYSDQGENDLEPTDFVSVKIEPMDDEEQQIETN